MTQQTSSDQARTTLHYSSKTVLSPAQAVLEHQKRFVNLKYNFLNSLLQLPSFGLQLVWEDYGNAIKEIIPM